MLSKQEIIALSQDEYRLKVTSKSERWGVSHNYIIINENNDFRVVADYDFDKLSYDAITSMTRSEWNKIMPHVKRFCETYWLFRDTKYTLKLEKAFSFNDVVTVYYTPKRYRGALTLAQLKKELKSLNIPIAAIEQDRKVHRYGSPEKYYRLYILKQYKNKLDQYIKSASDYGYISYDPLPY